MQADGVKKFLTFITSGFSCYPGAGSIART
jgi:hypothetical protein